jgi:MFS transporter, PPP family, 3-phenylpropionic acid transporter
VDVHRTNPSPRRRPTCARGSSPTAQNQIAVALGQAQQRHRFVSMDDSVTNGDYDMNTSLVEVEMGQVTGKVPPGRPQQEECEEDEATTEESSSDCGEEEVDSFFPNDDPEEDAEPLIPRRDTDGEAVRLLRAGEQQVDGPTFRGVFFFQCLFFLNGLSASTWGRFSVIYYNQIAHLTLEQMGLLQAITPLISLVMMPIWGALADYLHSRKIVYLLCKGLGTISLVSMAYLPHPVFGPILLCVSGVAIFRASGILDAYVLDYLGPDHRDRYGEIRLWTAVSWGIGAVVMGYVTDYWDFYWNFVLYGTMMTVMGIIVAVALPARSRSEQQHYDRLETAKDRHQRPEIGTLYKALVRLPIIWWIFEVSVIGCGMALVESFLFVYLQNDLGATTRLCGWTVGVTVLCEIPIFYFSKLWLRTIGHDGLFVIALFAYSTRVYGYTLLTPATVSYILALEILHGVTFACMWIASIDFSTQIAPPEWSTTVQSILSAAFTCFGSIVGPLIGGYIIQQDSAVTLYRGMALVVALVLVTHCFVWRILGHGHGAFLTSLDKSIVIATAASLHKPNDRQKPVPV